MTHDLEFGGTAYRFYAALGSFVMTAGLIVTVALG
jgi:hypothetical protein